MTSAPVLTDEHVTTPEDTPVSGQTCWQRHRRRRRHAALTGFTVGGQHYLAGDTATLAGKAR
jgi:hypothetical protein